MLYPSEIQKVILNKILRCYHVVCNERLSEHVNYYNIYKDKPNRLKFQRTLPKELREKKYPCLKEDTKAGALA